MAADSLSPALPWVVHTADLADSSYARALERALRCRLPFSLEILPDDVLRLKTAEGAFDLPRRRAWPIISRTLKKLSRAEKRHYGAGSLRRDVHVPKAGGCALKRHFIGVYRQVIGYAELLASRDPERFVFASARSYGRNARKCASGRYADRQIYLSMAVLESLGLLTPAVRVRNHVERRGFIVADHDTLATVEGSRCVLVLPGRTPVSVRARGEKRDSAETAKRRTSAGLAHARGEKSALSTTGSTTEIEPSTTRSTTPSTTESTREVEFEHNTEHYRVMVQPPGNSGDTGDGQQYDGQNAGVYPFQPCHPIGPSKEEPMEPSENHPLASSPSGNRMTESDKIIKATGMGKDDKTSDVDWDRRLLVSERLDWNWAGMGARRVVEVVTDGEFNPDALAAYPHSDALSACCIAAVGELAAEVYSGRPTLALIMDKSMSSLRSKYGHDAPRGWLPVLKRLRAAPCQCWTLRDLPPADLFDRGLIDVDERERLEALERIDGGWRYLGMLPTLEECRRACLAWG